MTNPHKGSSFDSFLEEEGIKYIIINDTLAEMLGRTIEELEEMEQEELKALFLEKCGGKTLEFEVLNDK